MRSVRAIAPSLLVLALPAVSFAHAFGQQFTLPLPVHFYITGGLAAFIASCAVMLLFNAPTGEVAERSKELKLPWSRAIRGIFGAIGLVFFALSILVGFFGVQDFTQNPLPDLFWIMILLLLTYISAVIGGLWELVDPFKRIAALFDTRAAHSEPPRWLSYIPAVTLYLLVWLELFSQGLGAVPFVLAALMVIYTLFCVAMTRSYGSAWFERGEFFSTLFTVVGKIAPVRIARDRIVLAPPGEALVHEDVKHFGTLLFILVLLGSTVLDGLRETSAWWNLILAFDLSDPTVYYFTGVLALLLLPVILLGFYTLAIFAMKISTRIDLSTRELRLRFAYSLVPIAVAYHFAHYFGLVITQGQAFFARISDPFARGWDIFGTAAYQVNPGLIGADTVWYIQLAVIVLGHIFAAIVAHRIALRTFKSRRDVVVSQLPMLVLMVLFTAFGLWILAQPFA